MATDISKLNNTSKSDTYVTKSIAQNHTVLPWDRFCRWIHCICVVTFDLELGQALEIIYPNHIKLSEQEKSNICYLAFPDSNSGCMGDTQFHVRIRQSPGHSHLLPEHQIYNHKCPVFLQVDPGYYYGYVYFRQVKDKSLPRGYFQKSVVVISRLPFLSLFTEVCSLIAPEYFENGEPSIEAACHDIDQWPSPVPGETVNLPLLGTVLQASIPIQSNKPCSTTTLNSPSKSTTVVQSLPTVLRSIHEVNLFRCFSTVISHIHLLWELVLIGEPIVVMAASPTTCSEMVQALVSMIAPLMYCGDFRPYFTIHDSEFKEYTTKAHAPPHVILGVTNPFFAKTLQHWPHIIRICDSPNSSQKHKLKKGGNLKMLDSKPGVYTHYRPFLNKDKTILKKLLKGIQTKRPGEVQTALLKRHLLEVTQSFMIPLERYMASLMPLQKNISPYKLVVALGFVCADPQQGLPYPLHVIRLAPGAVSPHVHVQEHPVQADLKSIATEETEMEEEQETSQFHSQDSSGRSMFGYVLPGQVRIEARKPDGSVRGSYSYLDPTGRAVKVQYWDEGKGFHVAGNNLPIAYTALPQPVQETPEVQAAREEHMRLYQQTLLRQLDQQKLQSMYAPQPDLPSSLGSESISVGSDSPNPNVPPVVLGEDGKELTRYPNLQLSPALYDPSHIHDDTREAVIVETPDANGAISKKSEEQHGIYVGGKPIQKTLPEKLYVVKNPQYVQTANLHPSLYSATPIEYSFDQTKEVKNIEKLISSGEASQKSAAYPIGVIHTSGNLGTFFLKPTQIYETSKGVIDNVMRSNIYPHPPLTGYFGNSKESIVLDNLVGRNSKSRALEDHVVSMTEKKETNPIVRPLEDSAHETLSVVEAQPKEVIALKQGINGEDQGVVIQTPSKTVVALKDGKAESYSALYDVRVGKSHSADAAPHPENEGGFVYAFHHPVIPVVVHDAPEFAADSQLGTEQERPRPVQPSISQKATFYGAIPVAAVHDAQVHPFLKGAVKDHQTLPLYVEHVSR